MRYGVLGPVEAARDDDAVAVGGPQQRRLLALMLSRAGESISAERLVDCLWPDGLAPVGAARSVMTYVSRLRTTLGESSILTVDEGYRFDLGDSTIDCAQFEALLAEAGTAEPARAVEIYDRALGLWRGAAYGEYGGEWWLLTEAARLNEMRVVAMEERAEALLALGHSHRVIPEVERIAADHPLRERPVSLLMQALYTTGRHAEALRVYQAFRDRLADETGLEPSAELVELERSLVSGRPVATVSARSRLLRGYVVHDVLGEGAFGRVFAATQPGTNRQVAIKAIRPDLADGSEFIQRFEAEAQLVARLEHPHIVPLYDYWREPGGAYLVFRLLLGGTAFASMVSDGPFSVSRVSRLVEEVGGALLAAHTAGVVHCDIKSSNVLFDETGNAYLSDFGIAVTAATFDPAGQRTRAYAAPELVDRAGDTVRSDIFSFGCMLWELLVGASPSSVMQPTPRFRLPSLVSFVSGPCEALDAVLARATAADSEARYESMAELIVAWREAVGRPEGVLTPISSPGGSTHDSSRRRAVHALSAAVSSAVNPYRGLRSFAEADASDFFGRDDVAAALYETLSARKFVAVVGPSGSGKSSLVHAGLVPLLRRDGVRIVTMVPGDRPMAALRQALRQVTATDIGTDDPAELFHQAASDGAGQIVFIVDQFEECWTLTAAAERERFLGALLVAGQYGIRCATTVRADLYDRPLQHALIGRLIADGTFALPPLSPQSLEDAVVRPAARHGVEFEDGVISAIVAEASAQPAGLPLLQFALAELYEQRTDNCITAKSLDDLGGLGGAIGRRAEEIYRTLDDDMQAHARELFGRLISPGHGGPDTRRRARHGELSEPARTVADRFVAARLLVADRDVATREPVIEVGHEALLTSWPRLREWLDADRRWLAQLQHLATAARNWSESDRADGELYRGSRLEAVVEALPEHGEQLNADEHAFVAASLNARDEGRERERRSARRLRRLLATTAGLLAVALVAGLIAFNQRQHARTTATSAELTTLASRSLSLRSSQRDLAALLAVEAWQRSPDATSKSALFGTFTFDPGFLGYLHYAGSTMAAAVAIPGTTTMLVTHSHTGGSVVFDQPDVVDAVTGKTVVQLEATSEQIVGQWMTVSSNGRYAAGMQRTPTDAAYLATAFDLSTGRKIGPSISLPTETSWSILAIDATGSRLAVGTDQQAGVTIYATSSGKVLAELPGLLDEPLGDQGYTGDVEYGPDGRLYVGSTDDRLRIFDPSTFALVDEITVPRDSTAGVMKFSADGDTLVGRGWSFDEAADASRISIARVDLVSRSTVWHMTQLDDGSEECGYFAFSVETDRLWCGTNFGQIQERSMTTGELTGQVLENQRGGFNSLNVMDAPGGRMLVAANDAAGLIGRWRVDGGGPIERLVAADHVVVADLPDGKTLLVGKQNNGNSPFDLDYSLWDVAADRAVRGLPRFTYARAAGNIVRGIIDGAISTYNVASKQAQPIAFSLDERGLPTTSAMSRDGDGLLLGYDAHVALVDVATGGVIQRFLIPDFNDFPRFARQLATNDDHSRVYVAGPGLFAFDAETGDETARLDDPAIASVAVSTRGVVAAATRNGTIAIFDPNTLVETASLPAARGFVGELRFSDDGNTLLAASTDGTVSIYDMSTRTRLGDSVKIGQVGSNSLVDLRGDGKQAAITGSGGSGVVLLDLDPDHWVTAACALAGRSLTRDEWAAYIGDLGSYRATCPEFPEPPASSA